MLAQLLKKQGIGARVIASNAVSVGNIMQLDVTGVQMACLSYLEAGGLTSARFLVRRLRRRLPHGKILVGFWRLNDEQVKSRAALQETGADLIVTSLGQAVGQVSECERKARPAEPPASPSASNEPSNCLVTLQYRLARSTKQGWARGDGLRLT
jgi:hypothetical protein